MYILQLNTDQSCEWIETNSFLDVIATRTLLNLSDCPKINAADLLVILIPGQDVVVTTMVLPKIRAAERARIAPFALEEQLASDPESVYIAFGMSPAIRGAVRSSDGSPSAAPTETGEKTVVAILNQSCFEKHLENWAAENLQPKIAVPDFLGIAWEPDTWTIVLHREMALVRTGLQSGYTVDSNNLIIFLKQYLEKSTVVKPKKIIVWQEDSIYSLHELDVYNIPIETRDAGHKNKWDTTGILTQLNLLQGKYRPKVQASTLEKRWKACGIIATVWIAFLFISQCVQWVYLRHEAAVISAQVASVYSSLFPGSSAILEPHFRAAALLKRYDQASHGGLFLKLYRAAGQTLLHYPDIHVQSFIFQDNKMQLTVITKNVGLLTQWNNELHAQNVIVTQTITKTDVGSVQALVIIS